MPTAASSAPASSARTRTPRLTPSEVAFFREEGYLLPQAPVFSPTEFQGLAQYFEELLAAMAPGERPEHMDVPHFAHPRLFEWLLSDAVLDLVEPLLGPDIALFSSHFICKPSGDGRRVPWHEDSAYWGDMLKPMEVVTVWLAIDPSDRDNGCMRIIPRTHRTGRKGYSDYEDVNSPEPHVFGREIKKEQYDASKAVDLVLQPNHASLHDGRLMHGSNKNTSSRRRCGYTMRYVPSSVRLHPDAYAYHQLYLARGVDRAGNRYGDPTRPDTALMERRANRFRSGH